MLLWGALVADGDCNRAGRPGPASEPSVLSVPAPAACAIANPQLPKSNAAANVNLVAFNIAYSPLAPHGRGSDGNARQHQLVPRRVRLVMARRVAKLGEWRISSVTNGTL